VLNIRSELEKIAVATIAKLMVSQRRGLSTSADDQDLNRLRQGLEKFQDQQHDNRYEHTVAERSLKDFQRRKVFEVSFPVAAERQVRKELEIGTEDRLKQLDYELSRLEERMDQAIAAITREDQTSKDFGLSPYSSDGDSVYTR